MRLKKISLTGLLFLLSLLLTSNLHAADITTTVCPGAGCVNYNVAGQGSIAIQITGTWSGTITFQSTLDNTNYVSFRVTKVSDAAGAGVTTTTSNGLYQGTVAGLSQIRVVFTGFVSGTAVVNSRTINQAAKFNFPDGGAFSCSSSNGQVLFDDTGTCAGDAGLTYNASTNQLIFNILPKVTGFVDGMWSNEDSLQVRPTNGTTVSLSLVSSYTAVDEWSGLLAIVDGLDSRILTLDKSTFDEGATSLNIRSGSGGITFDASGEIVVDVGTVGKNFIVNRDTSITGILNAASINTIAVSSGTTPGNQWFIQAYDVDGAVYKTFATLTNGNTPDFTISPPSGGTVNIQGVYKSNDGTSGATTTCTIVGLTSITVKNGLVTSCS